MYKIFVTCDLKFFKRYTFSSFYTNNSYIMTNVLQLYNVEPCNNGCVDSFSLFDVDPPHDVSIWDLSISFNLTQYRRYYFKVDLGLLAPSPPILFSHWLFLAWSSTFLQYLIVPLYEIFLYILIVTIFLLFHQETLSIVMLSLILLILLTI